MPEDPGKRDALRRALLIGGANTMVAGGPSREPINFLGAVGRGIGAGALAYDEGLEAGTKRAAEQVKLQQAEALHAAREGLLGGGSGAGGDNGQFGFDMARLKQIWEFQVRTGDDAGARDTLGMIQKLQQQAASNGMIVGEDGNLRLADGYGESLNDTERHKASGRVEGEEQFRQTDDIREYNLYVSQETAAGRTPMEFNDWLTALKNAGSTKVNVGGSDADDEYTKESAKQQAKAHGDMAADFGAATRDLATVGELRYALQDNPGGFVVGVQNTLSRMGIKLGDNVGSLEYANALINQLIPAQRPAGSGAMSDKDVEMFRQSLPQLMNTQSGNTLILNTMEAMARYRVELAKIAQQAQNGNISRQDATQLMLELGDPMAEFNAYREAEGGAQDQTEIQIPVVSTTADYEALAPGQEYIHNGTRMRKK